MLYRSTDRLCRAGAPVQYLAHSASFQAGEKSAPSNSGIKHLVQAEDVLGCRVGAPERVSNRAAGNGTFVHVEAGAQVRVIVHGPPPAMVGERQHERERD